MSHTILLADDDAAIRMVLNQALTRAGYEVRPTGNLSTMWNWASRGEGDLLITDVGLPGGLNGCQLADAARITRPDLKVLFITGYAENAVIGNGHLAPGMRVLTKPFVMEALANRILEMIGDDKAG